MADPGRQTEFEPSQALAAMLRRYSAGSQALAIAILEEAANSRPEQRAAVARAVKAGAFVRMQTSFSAAGPLGTRIDLVLPSGEAQMLIEVDG